MESSFKAVRRPESNRVPCNWNIAPSQDVLVIRFNPETGLREPIETLEAWEVYFSTTPIAPITLPGLWPQSKARPSNMADLVL